MQNYDDIKSVWLTETAATLPSTNELAIIIKKQQKKRRNTAYMLWGILLLCFIGYIALWFGYKTNSWTIKTGELLMFAAILYSIYHSYKDIQKKRNAELLDSDKYLTYLKQEIKEKASEKKRVSIFLTLFCVAYGFFFYDKATVNLNSLAIWYGSLMLAIAFFRFIYWPIANRLHQKAVQHMISKIENIQNNLITI